MILFKIKRFGTIRNSTALKQDEKPYSIDNCFGTIRNSTALKLFSDSFALVFSFGTIRNSTALKQTIG
uniref:hypothetical protein n=1 Tax=Streptococcus agalactiae TaxID=1311 RepID=UPI000A763A7E